MSAITVTEGIDARHQHDGDGDNGDAHHDVVDEDDEERDLIHVGFEAADGFAR
ncbi:MAG: hypothetical protein HND47_15060 [Chloroflexi bacterium]|nr:hypothetical protein [Chloroflexota bacterium]